MQLRMLLRICAATGKIFRNYSTKLDLQKSCNLPHPLNLA
jgi:hypothetical protein